MIMFKICGFAKCLPKDKFIQFVDAIRRHYPHVADIITRKYKEISGKELTTEIALVPLPSQFVKGALNLGDPEELAREEVLDMKVFDLKCILPDLHKIYQHLSIDNAWEHLAGAFGLTIEQTLVYGSIPRERLPAEIFITVYCHESGCTLREFLKALIEITPRYNQCQELAERLWNTALHHNSEFYKRRYPPPH